MSKFPWKTTLAGAVILAAAGYALAAQLSPGGGPNGQMHQQMMQGQGFQGQDFQGQDFQGQGFQGHGMHGAAFAAASAPAMPGQDAFGAIQEIVQILEADPSTDWAKVNIAALREHLIDMNEVTLHAAAKQQTVDNSLVIAVTGEGRTLAAIKRMVPAHVHELQSHGWNAKTEEMPDGVTLTVTAADAAGLVKLKALGFIGIMVQGGHHQPHHLMIAKGELPMH